MPRVLLLLPTTTYRTRAFVDAALKLGADVVAASELPNTLAPKNPEGLLTLDFQDPERAAAQARAYGNQYPVDAVVPVDDDTAVVAAHVAAALGLRHNSIESVVAAKNKHLMRSRLHEAGIRVPRFWRFSLDDDPARISAEVHYPCVLKPVFLSTSRGVMRANNETEFVAAFQRLDTLLKRPDLARRGGSLAREALAEEFIPGFEVALEGILIQSDSEVRLKTLAIMDKPDPLDGPFFEETIYVTPSRLSLEVQQQIAETALQASRALGLTRGPIHAELRINEHGPWIVEVAARAIGGLCSRTLRFDQGLALEDLILMQAVGRDIDPIQREPLGAGVMMIPIPKAGILREVKGIEAAMSTGGVEDVIITAHLTQEIIPPPEGASYLGFIFSRGQTAAIAEAALREAHRRLEFVIEPRW